MEMINYTQMKIILNKIQHTTQAGRKVRRTPTYKQRETFF